MQDEVETPWRKSLCKVVSKGEGSLEDLEPDGSTKSNLWSDAPFMSFTTLSSMVRGGVMLLQSRTVSHDRTVPTDRNILMYPVKDSAEQGLVFSKYRFYFVLFFVFCFCFCFCFVLFCFVFVFCFVLFCFVWVLFCFLNNKLIIN